MSPGCHCIYDAGPASVGEEGGVVDIVAIHDVGEHPFDSWTDAESGTNWLRDLLPTHVPVGRVVLYGYDAKLRSFAADDAPENVQRMAESLVQELRANRQFAGTLRRPIVFLCHGIGGILLKKSLIYSSTRTAPKVVHLWDQFVSTFAILFFGTPHGASSTSDWLALERQSSIVSSHGNGWVDAGERFQIVQSVNNDFMPLVKQFHMFFFWEALPTPHKGRTQFIVSPESAVPKLDNTEAAAIHATHSQMVKFGSSDTSDYRTVIAALMNYCEKAPEIISHRWEQAETVLAQLRASEAWELGGYGFDVRLEEPFRHRSIPVNHHFYPPSDTTCTFVGRKAELKDLHDALFPVRKSASSPKKNTFVVFGMGGSGKTQFCSEFAHAYKNRYTAVFTIYAASKDTIVDSFCRIGKIAGLEATENSGRHFLSQLAGPWLLIFDNADNPALDIKDYYPSGYAAHILITTRNPDVRREGTCGHMELGGLDEEDALRLLLVKADIPMPWDISTRESASMITKALGYLALALIQAGNCIYRQICKLSDYLHLHSAARSTLRCRKASEQQQLSEDDIVRVVYSTFDVSLGLLPKETTLMKDAKDLLRIFSCFHFEHIPVQLFTRAFKNREEAVAVFSRNTLKSRLVKIVQDRIQPPKMLPDFLKLDDGAPNKYRIMHAVVKLRSLSLISFDGGYISLHPLVHAWARDNLSNMEQKIWVSIALNTILESILLPSDGGQADDGEFHRDVLPHLEICLEEHGSPIPNWINELSQQRLRISIILQPTSPFIIKDQIQRAAKCGWIFAERGLFDKARLYLHMVKGLLTRMLGEENEKTLMAMHGLATVQWGLGQVDDAITLQRSVVDIRHKVLGPMDGRTLLAMDHLGRSYWLHGLHAEALELQQTTVERIKATIGLKDPLYPQALAAMDNLGVTLGACRQYQESMEVHREVLEARETLLGKAHPDTLTTKANLSMALLDLGHVEEARKHIEVVYKERQKQLGKEHPWTLWALCYLAKVYIETGDLETAESTLHWGIEAGIRSLSETHPGVIMGRGVLARVYAKQGRLNDSETLTLKTVEIIEESHGIAHPDCVYGMLKLGHLYVHMHNRLGAINACRRALEGVDLRIKRTHPLGKEVERMLMTLEDNSTTMSGLSSLIQGFGSSGLGLVDREETVA